MKISPTQSDFLNWSRWVAAWFVVAEHARSLVFVDFGELHAPGILAKGFYFLTGFGHEAVMVFFVISGYLVGGKVWSLYREGRFAWRRYLADRLSRLYAVLIVALVLGAALDWTGYMFFNKYGLYDQGYAGSIAVLGAAPITRMGGWDFLVNAFFLQTIVGPPFGSNGPLWSLAYEWWYYILFPLVLAALWPIVNSGWRRTEEKAETLKKLKAEKVQPRIAQMGTDEEARGTEQGERGTAKSGNAQKLKHEIGKIIDSKIIGTTKDTNQHEKEEAGARLTSQSGAAFSNPFTSELLRNSENTSFTRSASGPAGALRSGEMGSGGGNQLGDSVEFLDGQSQAGLQMDSQKRHSPRAATGSDTSGEISLSVPIRDIRGSKSEALDAGLSTLDLSPRQRFMIGAGSFLAVAGLCWFLTWHILILFGVWLLGVVSAVFGPKLFSFQPSVFKWTFLLISTGISFGSLLVARVEFLKWGALDQFLIGIGFSLLLAALAPMAWRFPLQGWAHYFSDFSYSVYLIHFPVIMFALSMGFDLFGNGTRMPFGLLALGWYACIFSLAIFMSWLVSQFTERKTATLRKWLYGLLSVRES